MNIFKQNRFIILWEIYSYSESFQTIFHYLEDSIFWNLHIEIKHSHLEESMSIYNLIPNNEINFSKING